MPSSIAFFPWVSLDDALTIGPVRLIPYRRGRCRSGYTDAQTADIDGVLRAYALRKDQLVKEATLLEFGDWYIGQDAAVYVDQLFQAREFIAFAALAKRHLFSGHMDYCNFDTYALVIQNYQVNHTGAFSFTTRRRDGNAQYLWDSDEFAFLKPLHIAERAKFEIDEPLLDALLKASEAEQAPLDAIVEFNRANTDSQDIPVHTEVVLTKSAFEFLFAIGHEVNEFVDVLLPLVPDHGSSAGHWKKRWPRAARPLEAWAREFCAIRGGAAHGKWRDGGNFVWPEDSHLAFASILFPLLVKQKLTEDGYGAQDERDSIHLELIEAYLARDPFQPTTAKLHEHPWTRVYSEEVLGELLRRRLTRKMDTIDWKNIPE